MLNKTFDKILVQPNKKVSTEQIQVEVNHLLDQIKRNNKENKSYQRMSKDIRALWHLSQKIKNNKIQGFEELTNKTSQLIDNTGKLLFENKIKDYKDLIEFLNI